MKIAVCVKEIYNLEQVKIVRETREPILDVPKKLDDLSRNALEEAIKIREKLGGEIVAISAGSPELRKTIKEALAMGADRAAIVTDFTESSPESAALVLSRILEKDSYDLILLGDASSDDYSGQMASRVAETLNLPQITFVSEIREVSDGKITCVRDMDDYIEVVESDLPCVVSVTNEINEPRIPALKDILKASKKPVENFSLQDLGIEISRSYEIVENLAPAVDRKQEVIEGEAAEVAGKIAEIIGREV